MTEDKEQVEEKPQFRTEQDIQVDIDRKGATPMLQLEVLLDIRELLIGLNEGKK